MNKRGVSPVIATVLLILIVIVLAAIIFLWARGFVSESVEKNGRAVELSCENVNFQAEDFACPGSTCVIDVVNRGNIPIYGFDVKIRKTGETLVENRPGRTVGLGGSISIDIGNDVDLGNEVNVVPMILGETDGGKVVHTCEDRFGYALVI